MKFSTVSLLAVIFASTPCLAALERSFTDDSGITHTTSLEKPTIVTFAHTATSLFDYGKYCDAQTSNSVVFELSVLSNLHFFILLLLQQVSVRISS